MNTSSVGMFGRCSRPHTVVEAATRPPYAWQEPDVQVRPLALEMQRVKLREGQPLGRAGKLGSACAPCGARVGLVETADMLDL